MTWSTVWKAVKMIKPPSHDAPDSAVRRWRWIVSGMLVTLVAFALTAIGLVPYIPGHAFADDLAALEEVIDSKIEDALKPANAKLDEQGRYLKRLVSKDIRTDIYDKLTDYCNAPNGQKAGVREEIDNLQDEYKEATGGERYPEPRCDDI